MKTSAIVRLILWSLLALILSGLLIAGLIVDSLINIGSEIGWGWVSGAFNESDYSVGDADISDDINSIDIHWISGSVRVEVFDGDKVEIREDGYNTESEKLRYRVSNGKLTVQFSKTRVWFLSYSHLSKDLVVRLPRNTAGELKTLDIESVSAKVYASGLHADELEVESVSGGIELEDISADTTELKSVSGKIVTSELTTDRLDTNNVSGKTEIYGNIGRLDAETVSGSIVMSTETTPDKADLNSVSGSITLYLPEDCGFTAKLESVSGKVSSDFAMTSEGKKYTCGDGQCKISAETVSGGLNIRKIK